MQNKLRQLIISVLKRNEFTCNLPLHISLRGYEVVVSGFVTTEDEILEVIATIESVSPYLQVHNRLKARRKAKAGV